MEERSPRARDRLRRAREQRGLSQLELAGAAKLTRQSIGAIEAGRATPSVDVALRLAEVLGRSVESLFGQAPSEESLLAEAASSVSSRRLAVVHIGGRWVAHGLGAQGMRTSADALADTAEPRGLRAELLRAPADARENVAVMGCAAGLGLLADRLNVSRGPGRFLWLPCSSTEALEMLAKDQTHLAGVHLVDAKTGEANVVDVRRIVGRTAVALVTLGRWEVGLVAMQGRAGRSLTSADLGRVGLKLAVREKGSGARRVLDRALRRAGVNPTAVLLTAVRARGHLEVAHAVALGTADVGVATRDAAIAFGLDFVPLAEERYDVAMRAESVSDARIQRILDCMCSAGFRRELSSLGYDVRSCGDRVAASPAADEGNERP